MPQGSVEVVIAVHDVRRPLARTLASVLDQREQLAAAGAELRVQVVVHNRPLRQIRDALPPELAAPVAFHELADGIRSPAGPFNAGLDAAEGEYVSTVGSDDVLEPGALGAWYARARETKADAVIAALRRGDEVVRTPYLRPGRRDLLDPVADRLAYRTAPLGLLRTSTVRSIGFRYTGGGHLNGEDVEPGLRMWFRGGRIAYPYGAPCYRILEDMGAERATAALGPLSRELGFLRPLLDQRWLQRASREERTEIAVKLARAQVIGALRRRVEAATNAGTTGAEQAWSPADASFAAEAVRGLRELAADDLASLASAETAVLTAAGRARDADDLVAAWHRVHGLGAAGRVLPHRMREALSRSGRARTFASQQLAQRTGSFEHPAPPAGWLERLRSMPVRPPEAGDAAGPSQESPRSARS